MIIGQEKYTAKIDDYVEPDGWYLGNPLQETSDFKDSSFPGCQFRLRINSFPYDDLAVNITVTGKPHYHDGQKNFKSRCEIEFVGDGEKSTFSGGWLYHY